VLDDEQLPIVRPPVVEPPVPVTTPLSMPVAPVVPAVPALPPVPVAMPLSMPGVPPVLVVMPPVPLVPAVPVVVLLLPQPSAQASASAMKPRDVRIFVSFSYRDSLGNTKRGSIAQLWPVATAATPKGVKASVLAGFFASRIG
jgi:hypothetical protein